MKNGVRGIPNGGMIIGDGVRNAVVGLIRQNLQSKRLVTQMKSIHMTEQEQQHEVIL